MCAIRLVSVAKCVQVTYVGVAGMLDDNFIKECGRIIHTNLLTKLNFR